MHGSFGRREEGSRRINREKKYSNGFKRETERGGVSGSGKGIQLRKEKKVRGLTKDDLRGERERQERRLISTKGRNI